MAKIARSDKEIMIKIINSIDLGNPVAEHDTVLYNARIETSAYTDLFGDRIDLVPGTKGSGKTALYRLISEYSKSFMLKSQIVILTGVEATGDPVFQAFKKNFEELSEIEFENFWRVYFVALILERFVKNPDYAYLFVDAKKEVSEFKEKCRAAHIPEFSQSRTFRDIVQGVLRCIRVRVGNTTCGEDGISFAAVEVEQSKSSSDSAEEEFKHQPVFLNHIHDAVVAILERADIKIWIMLDRLDEVFPRRTDLERVALRALLRSTRNFSTDLIRIKLFLRDDIFENILVGSDGFTALSHVEARRAETLRWGPKEIQLLIVKRLVTNSQVRRLYRIEQIAIDQNDMEYAEEIFEKIFPEQVVAGNHQSKTLDWIYHHCEDGRGVVTPRDVIDLLEIAFKKQADHLRRGTAEIKTLVGPQALKEALTDLSKKKCRTYLEAEFPEFWSDIKKFKGSKAEHNTDSLEHLLGSKWASKAENLVSLGFLQHRLKSKTYIVPPLFRAGMDIRQGKAFKNHLKK